MLTTIGSAWIALRGSHLPRNHHEAREMTQIRPTEQGSPIELGRDTRNSPPQASYSSEGAIPMRLLTQKNRDGSSMTSKQSDGLIRRFDV